MDPNSSYPLSEQARRSRAAIATSLKHIARSWQRISDSQSRCKPLSAWDMAAFDLTDAQRGALLERQHAQADQREIEREVGLTLIERNRTGVI